MALKAHTRVPEHNSEGPISIHVLSGHVQLRAAGRTFNLRSGGVLALDRGLPHDVHALEESAFLLTIASPGRRFHS
jgi:quercetin dioxygenase-like cupin family protein